MCPCRLASRDPCRVCSLPTGAGGPKRLLTHSPQVSSTDELHKSSNAVADAVFPYTSQTWLLAQLLSSHSSPRSICQLKGNAAAITDIPLMPSLPDPFWLCASPSSSSHTLLNTSMTYMATLGLFLIFFSPVISSLLLASCTLGSFSSLLPSTVSAQDMYR